MTLGRVSSVVYLQDFHANLFVAVPFTVTGWCHTVIDSMLLRSCALGEVYCCMHLCNGKHARQNMMNGLCKTRTQSTKSSKFKMYLVLQLLHLVRAACCARASAEAGEI